MSLKLEAKIEKFPSKLEKDYLESIYRLNQENTPEVGDLKSLKYLKTLIELSSNQYTIFYDKKIIGFIICFRENSKYNSPNYKFFKETEKKFLYIDRIAIDKNFRRQGFGEDLYKLVGSIVEYENIPLCCEVNVKPMNHISINFHKRQGFKKVGSRHFKDHSVAYFKK